MKRSFDNLGREVTHSLWIFLNFVAYKKQALPNGDKFSPFPLYKNQLKQRKMFKLFFPNLKKIKVRSGIEDRTFDYLGTAFNMDLVMNSN